MMVRGALEGGGDGDDASFIEFNPGYCPTLEWFQQIIHKRSVCVGKTNVATPDWLAGFCFTVDECFSITTVFFVFSMLVTVEMNEWHSDTSTQLFYKLIDILTIVLFS